MTRLNEVLEGHEANYILPLVWQRGEEEAIIREEIARIHEAGIRAVCLEARPHSDFLGPGWWHDIDIVMEEAKKRDMRVWVLDDDHFPTGHAAGKLKNAPPELRRLFLKEQHIDAVGPQNNTSFLIQPWLVEGDRLLAVVAAQRQTTNNKLTGEFIELTSAVQDGRLYWDIPNGYWRIFLLITTPVGGSEKQTDYLNPIVAESVKILIDTVYEAFYEHYQADFGKTFAGFFSDEPGFYNDKQTYDYKSSLGKKGVVLPWSREILGLLEAEGGETYRIYLPLLWHEAEAAELTFSVRYNYMNVVSKLYAENFTQQIGDWCRKHKVEYIGQLLEDNGIHARLGSGAGHFFRAVWGQDMSGIDVVLWQIVPGFDLGPFNNIAGDVDGEFFHYGLAKMASSLAHIDPKKQGRTVCEIFGAYGWSEGLKLMKWLTDHMLVRGINYFVPHAFSQAEFPDREFPPHFYARGKNPQYRYYRELNYYTNRLSHLLSGGRHIASAAVLYHAEAEWSGAAMPFERPVKVLLQNQLDCDVLPGDVLLTSAVIAENKLMVEDETYQCLIVPYCEALPRPLLLRLTEFALQGLPVIFVDGLPVRFSEGHTTSEIFGPLVRDKELKVVALEELASWMRTNGFYEIEVEGYQPYLRNYHVQHEGLEVYMFFNEHPYQTIETNVSLPGNAPLWFYDAFQNTISTSQLEQNSFSLKLSPYESRVVVRGHEIQALGSPFQKAAFPDHPLKEKVLGESWLISRATAAQYPTFEDWGETKELAAMNQPDRLPAFSGTFRYKAEFEWTADSTETAWLDLGEVYETAEVWLNGQTLGVRICPPYRLPVGKLLQPGQNKLVIEVTNTVVKEQPDFFSRFAQQEPSGLLGPVRLLYSLTD